MTLMKIEVGETINPFREVKQLESIPSMDFGVRMAEVPLKLHGLDISICLLTEMAIFDDLDLASLLTPLGKVQGSRSIDNGQETVSLPVIPFTECSFSNMADWRELRKHLMEITAGGLTFYLRCSGHETEERAAQELELSKESTGLVDIFPKNEYGEDLSVLLPPELDKLAQIRIRIIERQFKSRD